MKRFEAVVSTTRLDSQGERMSREAIQGLVDSISRSYIPIGTEHDPRIPPQGRIGSGFVREAPDGEFEAVAIMELFDDDESLDDSNDGREIVTRSHRVDGLTISSDWTHRHEEDQSEIQEIASIFGSVPIYDAKKAADPISVVTIGGAFLLGGIANGFLSQIGEDAWKPVRKKLARVFARKDTRKGDQLLVLSALLDLGGKHVEVELILSNPSPAAIDEMLNGYLQMLDAVVPVYLHASEDIRRLTFEVTGEGLDLKFAVRKDCRPVVPSLTVKEILDALKTTEPRLE